MADHKFILSATTPDNVATSKTIEGINPEASNEQLKTLGQMLNGLTDNTYVKTDRVIKYNCDTEGGGGGKQTPTLTLSKTSCAFSELKFSNETSASFTITTDSDGAIYVKPNQTSNKPVMIGIGADLNTAGIFYANVYKAQNGSIVISEPQTITIGVAESDNFKAAEVTFTVTA